jgi:hypothetical protein
VTGSPISSPVSIRNRIIRRRRGVLRASFTVGGRDPLCRVIKQSCQNIGEPGLRVNVVELDGGWLEGIPAARAISEATAPGSMAAATIRSFSACDQRWRRRTDVITSTCALVLGLHAKLFSARRRSPNAYASAGNFDLSRVALSAALACLLCN